MAGSQIDRIRQLQTEIMRRSPGADIGLLGNPGASKQAIEAAEARLECRLPPSYRAFLACHDGWPRFFEGATLLGTANLGRRLYADLAEATLEASEAPVVELLPRSWRRPSPARLLPFGADLQAATLFAFNPAERDASGEYEVVAWINEIGLRRPCFESFLELVAELCEAHLTAKTPPAVALTA